ncbi:hypothetical protein Tco_1056478 [Tanacetum coccineum]|uniref:Retrovirus-related Pol polyprotein from transposon TNT 1-94-like beta-barrel domain-containing protein n=1 Tax=Tanacetum coccineum TaxID=301880 RepID=A0ABQ5H3Q7_9ASTR
MVPRTVLTRSGLISVNVVRPVNTVQSRTTVNNAGPMKNVINNAYSITRRPFNKITIANNSNFTKKVNNVKGTRVNTARPKAVISAIKGSKGNSKPQHGNPHQDLKDKGVIDSRCSRHMTGNKSYLTDYEEIDGGFVAFGGNSKGGKITRKVPAFLKELIYKVRGLQALFQELNQFVILLGEWEGGQIGQIVGSYCDHLEEQSFIVDSMWMTFSGTDNSCRNLDNPSCQVTTSKPTEFNWQRSISKVDLVRLRSGSICFDSFLPSVLLWLVIVVVVVGVGVMVVVVVVVRRMHSTRTRHPSLRGTIAMLTLFSLARSTFADREKTDSFLQTSGYAKCATYQPFEVERLTELIESCINPFFGLQKFQ